MIAVVLTVTLFTTTLPTYADDSSSTDVTTSSNQKAIVSGIKPNVLLCEQINLFDSKNTAGDEGQDCHNQREENSSQNATD